MAYTVKGKIKGEEAVEYAAIKVEDHQLILRHNGHQIVSGTYKGFPIEEYNYDENGVWKKLPDVVCTIIDKLNEL